MIGLREPQAKRHPAQGRFSSPNGENLDLGCTVKVAFMSSCCRIWGKTVLETIYRQSNGISQVLVPTSSLDQLS